MRQSLDFSIFIVSYADLCYPVYTDGILPSDVSINSAICFWLWRASHFRCPHSGRTPDNEQTFREILQEMGVLP